MLSRVSGLHTPTALLALLTVGPAVILAWLGWRASAPWLDELGRRAHVEATAAADATATALEPSMQAHDEVLRQRLTDLAARLGDELPMGDPGCVLGARERAWQSAALRVLDAAGNQLLPRGPTMTQVRALPEQAAFSNWQVRCANGGDRDVLLAEAKRFVAPALRVLAIATVLRDEPAAAVEALGAESTAALMSAGPSAIQILAGSALGTARLTSLLPTGALYHVAATEHGRLGWLHAAGAQVEELQAQTLRARRERGEALLTLRVPIRNGATLELMRDPAQAIAELEVPHTATCDVGIQLDASRADRPPTGALATGGRVTRHTTTPWGPVAITATHCELPAWQARATRQRWLTGLGIALLCGVLLLGVLLARRALRQERQARTLRDDFIANVSHELKTPLTSLRLHAEMLTSDDLDAASRARSREVVQAEGARLTALVDDLLDFAALERGRRRIEPEPVDLGAAVRAMHRAWQPLATPTFAMRCDATDDAIALVDPTSLSRILTNLLQNALRHGRPPRRGEVSTIDLRAGPGPVLEVCDNGPGLASGVRAAALDGRPGAPSGDGLGLGLALSHELARSNGGTLEHVDDGTHTVFRLRLPPVSTTGGEPT